MKEKSGFNLRKVCGENIIVAEGKENIDFSHIIAMNESSAYLWESLKDKEFTVEMMAELLQEEYEVDEATALEDAEKLAALWGKAEIIEGDDIPTTEEEVPTPNFQDKEKAEEPAKENKGFFKKLFG